jgi:2'-5' RNA ligase
LEKVGVFPSKELIKVVWIGLSGQEIVHLIQKIEQLLRYLRAEEHQEIVPHLTLARVKSGKNKLQLQEALAQLENSSFGTLPVDKVFLYESRLTPQGPVYNLLQEFDLK